MMQPAGNPTDINPRDLFKSKPVQMFLLPVRVIVSLSLIALVAGGPNRFFSELPGQVFAGLFLLQVVFERIFMAPDLGGSQKDRGSLFVAFTGLALTYVASVVDWYWVRPLWSPWPYHWVWLVIGGCVFAGGMVLRLVSMVTLGKFFTGSVRIHEGHEMIQHGPYRLLRHPAYLGLSIITLGCATLFASFMGYISFVILYIPGLMRRIKVEEEVLTEEFGDGYREYSRRTKRLVPFVY